MGNLAEDIINEVDLPPKKSKLIIKILIGALIPLISVAFVYGGIKVTRDNKITTAENEIVNINQKINLVINEFDSFKDNVHLLFDRYQDYNNKQLNLVIDYKNTSSDLLKRMLELNSTAFGLENQKDSTRSNIDLKK